MSDLTYVYVLEHEYRFELTSAVERKFIGVFSSLDEVDRAKGMLQSRAGFRDRPADFVTTVFRVGSAAITPFVR